MRKTFINSAVAFLSVVFFGVMLVSGAHAQNLLPKQIQDIFNLLGPGGSGTAGFIRSRVQLGLVIVLGAVVLIAVVYAVIAAIKYISSQGDSGKIEEAQKAVKAIFFGIAAMLIAIVGIVLVFVFFGASQPDPSLFQTCLSAPNSAGCTVCKDSGRVAGNGCDTCEKAYEDLARVGSGSITDPNCVDPIGP